MAALVDKLHLSELVGYISLLPGGVPYDLKLGVPLFDVSLNHRVCQQAEPLFSGSGAQRMDMAGRHVCLLLLSFINDHASMSPAVMSALEDSVPLPASPLMWTGSELRCG